MNSRFLTISLGMVFLFFSSSSFADPDPKPVLIQGIQVIDVSSAQLMPETMDVMIQEGRIVDVQPAGKLQQNDETLLIDGSGKFLIPGLWDMHAHPDDPEMWRMDVVPEQRDLLLPQLVLHGVTGIRDMAG